jgi:hypothetical protein
MRRNVIDGDIWITARIAFLRRLLKDRLSEEERTAFEAEIASRSNERGIHQGGHRRIWSPWLRRLQGHTASED